MAFRGTVLALVNNVFIVTTKSRLTKLAGFFVSLSMLLEDNKIDVTDVIERILQKQLVDENEHYLASNWPIKQHTVTISSKI